MEELIAHLIGDYVVQSDWMATKKTTRHFPAVCHAVTYTAVFAMFFGLNWPALAIIGGTHFVIDRWRLARFAIVAKNWLLAPPSARPKDSSPVHGYPADTPPWMATWLFIIVDNSMHLLMNHAALAWWFPRS